MTSSAASSPQTVRLATTVDVDAIVAVTNRAFAVERDFVSGERTDATDIHARFALGCFFVVDDPVDAGRLAASVFCSHENRRGYLGLLSVDPQSQGRGLSPLLVAAVEQHCREAGCNFLDITVVNIRAELFSYYSKLGFSATDVLPFPLPDRALQPLLLIKMCKPLAAPGAMVEPRR